VSLSDWCLQLASGCLQCSLVPAILQVDACSKDWCPCILVSIISKWVLVMTGWFLQSCKLVLTIGMGVLTGWSLILNN
jgi:hypothetical protein